MSQIPRSQFALKKRSNPSPAVTIPVLDIEQQNGGKGKKSQNGSSNGHKNGSFDSNDVVIIDEECFGVVGHEEVVAATEEVVEESPSKKKRSRKSKDSTESKESSQKSVVDETQGDDTTASEKEIKIVKMSKRISDRLQNASTIVNLSSVSTTDQSTIVSDDTPPERRVGGRRSTRPIDEIKYTYRSTPNPDDSLNGTTTNATIGSDIDDSLLATPATDRKRRVINESTENLDTPKRSRLDLSGLFNSFSSPVAMLRNKFRRANIASTPVVGGDNAPLNESIESLDTSVGEEMKEVDLNKEEVVATAEEELKVKTTPVKKSSCSIM